MLEPRPAKFPAESEWSIFRRDGDLHIRCYLDTVNYFNAAVRQKFQIRYNADDELVSFVYDGVEMME